MTKVSVVRSRNTIIFVFIASILSWLTYTGITLHNYTQGVVSDMRGDLAVYYNANEKIAGELEMIWPTLMAHSKNNENLATISVHEPSKVTGLNIKNNEYSEYAGTLVLQDNIEYVNYDISMLMHALDGLWAQADSNAPSGFFVGYEMNEAQKGQYIYTKLRYKISASAPIIYSSRYREDHIVLPKRTTFISKLKDNYPKATNNVAIITPVEQHGDLVGDLGIELDLQSLMEESLGPWMHQYMALEVSSSTNRFITSSHRFVPTVFSSSLEYRNLKITAYVKLAYMVKYVLPWFAVMLVFLLFSYFILLKQRAKSIELSSLSETDEMTGLYNKRALDKIKNFDIESGSVFYLDINAFKVVNDTYGHSVGDVAIKYVADSIKKLVRTSDLCFRVGGDEFLIITDKVIPTPEQFMVNLHQLIMGTPYYHDLTITVSIGTDDFSSLDALESAIETADQKMYEYKKAIKKQNSMRQSDNANHSN